jgi:hypothetical protein
MAGLAERIVFKQCVRFPGHSVTPRSILCRDHALLRSKLYILRDWDRPEVSEDEFIYGL